MPQSSAARQGLYKKRVPLRQGLRTLFDALKRGFKPMNDRGIFRGPR